MKSLTPLSNSSGEVATIQLKKEFERRMSVKSQFASTLVLPLK